MSGEGSKEAKDAAKKLAADKSTAKERSDAAKKLKKHQDKSHKGK